MRFLVTPLLITPFLYVTPTPIKLHRPTNRINVNAPDDHDDAPSDWVAGRRAERAVAGRLWWW